MSQRSVTIPQGREQAGTAPEAGDGKFLLLQTYGKLLEIFTPGERRTFFFLLGLILFMGLAQMVGIAAILPFLAVLGNPEVIETNPYLAALYNTLGFTQVRSFLIFLAAAVFLVVLFSLVFQTVTQYAIYRFSTMRGFSISSRLLKGYLSQPYPWFLHRHSSDLQANVLVASMSVMASSLMPAMRLIAHGTVVLFVVTLLILVDPIAAGVLAVLLGGAYALIYLLVRRRLTVLGDDRLASNILRFRVAGEAIGGIKDVKLLGLEDAVIARFIKPAHRLAECDAENAVMVEMPRYLLEVIALGGMLLFVLFLLHTGDGTLGGIVPILGVYAFAALRMFPALQMVYGSFTSMRFSQPTLDKVHADMMANPQVDAPAPKALPARKAALRLTERLELDDLHYAYPEADRIAVHGLEMTIDARTTVGIVGGTGAGKTTVVDLILGLLEPQHGTIRVDGVPLTAENRRAWQNSIGYVPQSIFLSDDTVTANIAFGLPPEAVNHAAVERAARLAALHDFVTDELPQGYDTLVGERGVRLSGGQRQRIGIARALYGDPDVLILDEATSALDNLTEREVMEAVHNLGHAKTIVMIAHRLSTVRNCDIIHLLERGRVVASGRYEELVRDSETFRAMAASG